MMENIANFVTCPLKLEYFNEKSCPLLFVGYGRIKSGTRMDYIKLHQLTCGSTIGNVV
jgi:hypothetical protein